MVISESVVKRDFAFHPDLVGRDPSLEDVRQLLHVLQVHKRERILRSVARGQAEHRQTLVGGELHITPHLRDAHPRHSAAQKVFGKLRPASLSGIY